MMWVKLGDEVMGAGSIAAEDVSYWIIYTKVSERRMGGIGAFVRRKRSVRWVIMGHLYEGTRSEDGRYRSGCTVRSEKSL